MPRRTLAQNIKDGELTIGNVGAIIGVSPQKAKRIVIDNKIKYRIIPLSNEYRVCSVSLLDFCNKVNIDYALCLEDAAKNKENKDKEMVHVSDRNKPKPLSVIASSFDSPDNDKPSKPSKPRNKKKKTEALPDDSSCDDIESFPISDEFE